MNFNLDLLKLALIVSLDVRLLEKVHRFKVKLKQKIYKGGGDEALHEKKNRNFQQIPRAGPFKT